MDEEKRRRRALEAGREMLESYKSKRTSKRLDKSLERGSDEDSFHNEAENQSMDLRSISNNENGLSRDITFSSVSMSEGEGEGDIECLAGRINELEELLQGKEAVVEALNAEIGHIRCEASSPTSSYSQNSNANCREIIAVYHTKFQEFEQALKERDGLIEDLSSSLQQALAARDVLLQQISNLNSSHAEQLPEENVFVEKISALENDLSNQKKLVSELASRLEQAQENVKKVELEKETQSTELSDYKDQVENLNKKIRADSVENDLVGFSETHQLQKQEEQIEKIKKDMKMIVDKFATETKANKIRHDDEIKALKMKHEAELQKLKDENQNLEMRHAKEMSALQSQLSDYRHTVETLKLDLISHRESHSKERELLGDQIKLHKLQLDEITAKYVATATVLDSKESIERSLDQALNDAAMLRTENESLKFKLDDLSSRYSAAQGVIESNQLHERTLSNKIFTLEKSLSRLSGISFPELDETAYQTLDEMTLQYQIAKQKLDEKAQMEEQLRHKIEELENLVSRTRSELESANKVKDSYEKQMKDMKNTCDRMKSEMNARYSEHQRLSADSLDGVFMANVDVEHEILELRKTIEKRDKETEDYMKKLEELGEFNKRLVDESEKLKTGLATAYAQCAIFEEKLDQTLGFGESKLDDSNLLDHTQSSNASTVDPEELLHKQMNYNKVLRKLDACREQLKDYEREKTELLHQIENAAKEKEEILANIQKKEEQYREEIEALKMEAVAESQKFQHILKSIEEGNDGLKLLRVELETKHAKEMEDLRTYFEEKCLQMEKQYSEEIFSQQSKKMSDNDSELEELAEDLYVGGGAVECAGGGNNGAGDALGPASKKARRHSPSMNNEEPNICSEERIAKMAAEYEEKLENLRKQLKEVKEKSSRTVQFKAVNQFCQTERGSPSPMQESCRELNELRADYNRQLEEQVGLARIDIINALQEQIQALITVESESDENWPTELLELRNKFTNNSKREMEALKNSHALEIKRLKDMNDRAIKNLQEELAKIKLDGHASLESNLINERDKLHKTCLTLKNLVGQLIDYFVNCEEELNSTIISEVLKKQFSPRIPNSPFQKEQATQVKRVHFAPQSSEIASIVSSDSNLQDLLDSEKDVMEILKKDLDACLERLKSDSAKILNTSSSDSESWSTGVGEYPNDKTTETERLLGEYQEENELLKLRVKNLQQRLLNVENKKEVVSEGYGEPCESVREEPDEDFSQLQDRAKYVVLNGSNDTSYLLQLIEELCKYSDKRLEDLSREKEDLQHQQVALVSTPPQNIHKVCCAKIEAADKQLRSTRKFQEEQAVEREAERDEAAKQIHLLQERLREREREKDREHRNTSSESALSPGLSSPGSSTLRQIDDTVDALTSQLQSAETEKAKVQSELKTAVSKIWELRELIRDLEQQLQSKIEREDILGKQIEQLEEVIVAQTKNQQELVQELELVKSGSENNQLSDHIGHLQEELRKHQLSSEQLTANSSALKQLRLELRDLQLQLSRKTREIEALHVCVSTLSLSQPSEDVSIRDQIDATRCQTPDDPTSPPILPLDHVLKLKDNLLKHFRAEDVALKRLKDLELQVGNLQRQNEELLAEQELLQQTTSEQLFQIETLRARLEQQRRNAPFAQREATSKLESQLYDAHERLELAERALTDKDAELAEVKNQLERVSRLLAEKETEIANVVLAESDTTKKLKDTIRILEEENTLLQAKLSIQDKPQTNLPQIIDSMLAEKNAEIDHLRDQLAKREKQLEAYLSLDEHQLRDILRQSEQQQKNSARTLSDILSINSECEELSEMREAPNFTRSQNVSNFKAPNSMGQTTSSQVKRDVVDYSQAITETPKVPRLELDSCSHSDETVNSNLLEVSKEMESLQMQLDNLPIASPTPTDIGTQDSITSEEPNEYLCPRHGRMKNTNTDVDRAKTALKDMVTVQRIQELEIQIFELKEELTNKNSVLEQREAELLDIQNNLQQLHENISSLNDDRLFYKAEYEKAKDNESKIQLDLQAVENVLMKRTEELEDFRDKLQALQDEAQNSKHDEAALREKLEEITNLKEIIAGKDITIETLQTRTMELENENKQLYEYRCKYNDHQRDLSNYQTEIQRLNEGLNARDQMIRRLEEIARRSSLSGGSSPSEKDQEIFHLQEYLKEKDKVIRQMSDDSKSLQRALETIQNKMKESGNIVELRRKIKEERKTNAELTEEIVKLRTEVEMLSSSRRNDDDNDIAEMVQRELNLSARLDQQLLNVIDSEPEDVLKKCGDLKEANKVIDELNRLKDDLDIDREMLKSQISEYESRILQLKADNDEHSKRIAKLEEEVSQERHAVKSLQSQLRKEKKSAEEAKLNDTELIKQLNIKLHESLEIRDRLALEKKNLEMMNSMNNQNRKSPEIEAEQKKTLLTLSENLELEKRKCEELQDALKKMEAENKCIGDQLQTAKTEIEKLMSNVDLENLAKEQLYADLQRAKEELRTKTKECDWHKSMLKTVSDAEEKRKHQRSKEHSEIKTLKEELKNTQEILSDFETDMKALKEQLADAAERESQLTRCIKSLTDEETELTEQLAAVKNEEKKLRDIIVDQQNEIKLYMRREIELADELKKERIAPDSNTSPSKVLQRVKGLNATIDRLTQEKVHLYEKVERLREENERYLAQIRFLETQLLQKNRDCPSVINRNDSEERLQHFYGKFLRSDSRRKALIYQKHYLLCIIAGYQHSEENTLAFLAQLTQSQRSIARRGSNRRNGLLRFRSAVLLVVATQRMKWLILRWRTGRRVGANVVLGSMERQPVLQATRPARSAASGHSPPVRERAPSNGASSFSSYPYYRRLAEIQQNLHLRVPELNIDSYKSD